MVSFHHQQKEQLELIVGIQQVPAPTFAEAQRAQFVQAQFEALKKKLLEEGLFLDDRKKPLPVLPRHVGIVTSATGAAIRDILNVISRRFPNLHIILAPARVQGKEGAEEIAAAIDLLDQRGGLDAMIVGRGGGSLEDLWCFNEEVVARAIARCSIPVISAVGHEVDFTIADFVADLRAPTPSAAAELVVGAYARFRSNDETKCMPSHMNFEIAKDGKVVTYFHTVVCSQRHSNPTL